MSPKKGPVHLLWGEDAFLLRLAAFEALGELQPREVDAGQWRGGELADLATPSLFGERRALLVGDCRSLPEEAVTELAAYLASPDPESPLVLLARVGERGKPPAALVKLVQPVGSVQEIKVARKDLARWVLGRASGKAIELAPEGAAALLETIGEDPAALEQGLDQLGSAFAGRRIDRDAVAAQFRGLGDQHTWDLCDRLFARDLPGAMRSLQTLLAGGDDPLMVLGALASRLRDLLRVRALPERIPAAELATRAGLRFEWQARRYRDQAKRFTLDELVRIHELVAEADRALKSAASDEVVLPVLIAQIAGEPARV